MKRIIALLFAAALLLTGCSNYDDNAGNKASVSQITENNEKTVTEIRITEIGGEDGRDIEWIISQNDGYKTMVQKDNRFDKVLTYSISDEDYQALMNMDFSLFIGKKEDNDGVIDGLDYHISIIYEDESEDKSEVYIPDLWKKFYEIMDEYEPVNNSKANESE